MRFTLGVEVKPARHLKASATGAMGDAGVRGRTLSNSLSDHDGPSAPAPPALK